MGANLNSVEADVNALKTVAERLRLEAVHLIQAREDDRQQAYRERNELVAFLSRLYPSHLARHPESDDAWDPAWRTIVCIHAETLEDAGAGAPFTMARMTK